MLRYSQVSEVTTLSTCQSNLVRDKQKQSVELLRLKKYESFENRIKNERKKIKETRFRQYIEKDKENKRSICEEKDRER